VLGKRFIGTDVRKNGYGEYPPSDED